MKYKKQKIENTSIITGIKKTIKNYALPLTVATIGNSLLFLQGNCDPNAIIYGGITLGAITGLGQNLLKNELKLRDISVLAKLFE